MDKNDPRLKNLVQNRPSTPSERRKSASKAGHASVRARREHKAMRETLLELLSLPMKKGKVSEGLAAVEDFKSANVTVRTRIMLSMATKAAKGDVKAAQFIRDTIGEAPVQEVKVEQSLASQMSDAQLRKIISGEA